MWKPIFRHDKGLIEKIAIYTLIRKSNAITLPPPEYVKQARYIVLLCDRLWFCNLLSHTPGCKTDCKICLTNFPLGDSRSPRRQYGQITDSKHIPQNTFFLCYRNYMNSHPVSSVCSILRMA